MQQKVYFTVLVLIFNFLSFIPLSSHGQNQCNIGALQPVRFQSGSFALSEKAKANLTTAATKLKQDPFCTITAIAYPPASKSGMILCDKRTNMIKSYLIEKVGISQDRINTNCEVGGGDPNIVELEVNN